MNIEEQKAIADEIYSKLKIIDPYSILAGGAPRDWYFGKEANDLDFYFFSSATTVSATKTQLENFFSGLTLLMDKENHMKGETARLYKTMPFLRRIWEMDYKGVKVQLIQLSENEKQFKVVDCMDVSICQAWYMNKRIELHQNFKLTVASKIMFLTHGDYRWADRHGTKMRERFADSFYAGTKDSAINSLVLGQLRGVK